MKNLLLAFTALAGSTVLVAQERPPLRQLGAIEATSSEAFGPAINLRHTGDGVLVNDPRNRRVLLLDAQLNVKKVVADNTPATAPRDSMDAEGWYTADSRASRCVARCPPVAADRHRLSRPRRCRTARRWSAWISRPAKWTR